MHLRIWVKPLFCQSQWRFRNESKQKESYEDSPGEFLSNWQMQQEEGGKDFLMCKEAGQT